MLLLWIVGFYLIEITNSVESEALTYFLKELLAFHKKHRFITGIYQVILKWTWVFSPSGSLSLVERIFTQWCYCKRFFLQFCDAFQRMPDSSLCPSLHSSPLSLPTKFELLSQKWFFSFLFILVFLFQASASHYGTMLLFSSLCFLWKQ